MNEYVYTSIINSAIVVHFLCAILFQADIITRHHRLLANYFVRLQPSYIPHIDQLGLASMIILFNLIYHCFKVVRKKESLYRMILAGY